MSHFEVDTGHVSWAFRRWHGTQPLDDLAGTTTQFDPPSAPAETARALDALVSRLMQRFTQLRDGVERLAATSNHASEHYDETERLIVRWIKH